MLSVEGGYLLLSESSVLRALDRGPKRVPERLPEAEKGHPILRFQKRSSCG